MTFDLQQLALTAPMLVTAVGGLLLLLLEAFTQTPATRAAAVPGGPRPGSRSWLGALSFMVLGLAVVAVWSNWSDADTPRLLYSGTIVVDRFSLFLAAVFLLGAGLSVLLAGPFMREHRFEFGEHYALVLLAVTGAIILVQAADLVTIFLGVETMSLAVYVLTGSWRRSAKSSEAALKYFLAGAFASALLVYGIALIYGQTGTTSLLALGGAGRPLPSDLAAAGVPAVDAAALASPVFLVGAFFVSAAFAFKIAAVPFHLWAPDAYEGAPTPVTAFMAAAVKAAAFGAVVRWFATALGRPELTFSGGGWASLSSTLAILTMTLGNVVALRQDNVKRMLAWSSIAHAGYLLVGVSAMSLVGAEARAPLLYYLLAYTVTTVGAFGVLAWYGSYGEERLHLDDLAGLGARHPAAALAMTVLLLSLGAFPPTAGFFGKFYLFRAALAKPGLLPLVLVAVANSLVSVYYYLRPIVAMYFREPGREATPIRSLSLATSIAASALLAIAIGLVPGPFIDWAAAATLFLPSAR